jgi:hypothetical protein
MWIQQHALGVYGNLRILIISIWSALVFAVLLDGGRTEIDDIKDSAFPSFTDGSEYTAIITSSDSDNSLQRRPVMFDKFNSSLLLLPQLQMSIHRSRQQESSPNRQLRLKLGE